MKARLQSFLLMLAGATDKELAQQVQYLKEENRILRARLPKKLLITRAERHRLLRFGKPLGSGERYCMTQPDHRSSTLSRLSDHHSEL